MIKTRYDHRHIKYVRYLKEEPILEVKSGARNDGGDVFAINDFRRGHSIKAVTWASIMRRPRNMQEVEVLSASASSWTSFSLRKN